MRFLVQLLPGKAWRVEASTPEEARLQSEKFGSDAVVIGIQTRVNESLVCTPDLSSPYLNRDDAEQAVDRFVRTGL